MYFSADLSTLLSTYPPPFIYVQDSASFKLTCTVVNSVLKDISETAEETSFIIHYTRIDAISTFTNRLFFETVINSLAKWDINWEEGCSNWIPNEGEVELRWNENVDTFIHGLRAVHNYLCRQHGLSQAKGKEKQNGICENVRLVIVIERAERLKETIPELIVPLTRLAEMVSHRFYFKKRNR